MKSEGRISINELAQRAEVREDKASDVLQALCQMGWLKSEYINFDEEPEGEVIIEGIDRIE